MALTVTSRGGGATTTGTTAASMTGRSATLAVASLGVLCVALDNAGAAGNAAAAPTTATDSKGNVWTLRENAWYDNGAASAGIEMAFYTAPITVALLTTDTLTLTWIAGVTVAAKAWTWYEVIPSNGIAPEYLSGVTIAGATAANASVGTSINVNVGDAVIAGYFSENVAAVTGDADATNGSWTAQQTQTVGSTTSGVRIATQQKVQTTAASSQSYDVTVSSQDRIAGLIMVREVVAVTAAPTAASATLTGSTPTVAATTNSVAQPTAAAMTAAGSTPTVATTANVIADPTAGALVATGSTPTVAAPALSQPTAAALTVSGATPTVAAGAGTSSEPTAAAASLTGSTPTVAATDHKTAAPTAGAMTGTGSTPTVATTDNVLVLPAWVTAVITGGLPLVVATGADEPQPAAFIPPRPQPAPSHDAAIAAADEAVMALLYAA